MYRGSPAKAPASQNSRPPALVESCTVLRSELTSVLHLRWPRGFFKPAHPKLNHHPSPKPAPRPECPVSENDNSFIFAVEKGTRKCPQEVFFLPLPSWLSLRLPKFRSQCFLSPGTEDGSLLPHPADCTAPPHITMHLLLGYTQLFLGTL